MTLDPGLVAKLVCPITRTPLRYDHGPAGAGVGRVGPRLFGAGRRSVLLIEEARTIEGREDG
jgi:hypothetical protein